MVAARVSKAWYRVSRDELMWKSLFKRDWNISPKIGMAPCKLITYFILMYCMMSLHHTHLYLFVILDKSSWFQEYLRLWQQVWLFCPFSVYILTFVIYF